MRELPPVRDNPDDYAGIEEEVLKVFRQEIYLPLLLLFMEELGERQTRLTNSISGLFKAIHSGRIKFYRGRFTGKFSATITKELRAIGAKYDKSDSSFVISSEKLPSELKTAIAVSESRFKKTVELLDKKLAEFNPEEFSKNIKLEKMFDGLLVKTNKKISQNMKSIGIQPVLTPERARRISQEYTNNLQLYISDFSSKETQELRKNIQKRVFEGKRWEGAVDEIKKSYGVSERKAKFLARQETQLMVTKYTQSRYEEAGVPKYKWVCVNMPHQHKGQKYKEGEVRYHHAEHNGKIFRWSDPPVVNSKGDRKNPGQDFNCRCVARPVVEF